MNGPKKYKKKEGRSDPAATVFECLEADRTVTETRSKRLNLFTSPLK
jgi:hypothetical protein